MYHIVFKTKKEIIEHVIRKYELYIDEWKRKDFYPAILDRDNIYLKAFREMITLQTYGIWPLKAAEIFNDLTKLHIGKNCEEIHKLTEKYAYFTNRENAEPLTDEELKAVTEYHKYLFADFTKNENPFSLDL